MQELVVESLVVSLTMVVLAVLVDAEASMPLAERDDTMEALLFDRPDEPLGIGVEFRALRWQPSTEKFGAEVVQQLAWSLDFTRNCYWSVVRGSDPSQLRFSEDMNRDICDYLALIVGS